MAQSTTDTPPAVNLQPINPPVTPWATPPVMPPTLAQPGVPTTPRATTGASPAVPTQPLAGYCPATPVDAAPATTVGPKRGKWKNQPDWATPFGQSIAANLSTQVANGVAARMTLYDYDFERGTDKLNYRGRDRLHQIAALLPCNAYPVVVERLPYAPELADARRMTVLNELAAVLPPDRVVVGAPLAVPLSGVEAEIIYGTLINATRTAGVSVTQELQTGGLPHATPVFGGATGTPIGGGVIAAPPGIP
jgi:hypothetical protein